MRRSILGTVVAAGAVALASVALTAPAAQAADGTTSLASVLTSGPQGFDKNRTDYDIVTAAVLAVLKANPDSPVKVLADGNTAVTAFIPNDRAFVKLASTLSGKKVHSEAKAFATVAGLGIPTVEKVLEYHVIPGATILSPDALKANGAKLATALEDASITVKVNSEAPSIRLMDGATKLRDPRVILSQVDINEGNKQVAHGIDRVLLPMNP